MDINLTMSGSGAVTPQQAQVIRAHFDGLVAAVTDAGITDLKATLQARPRDIDQGAPATQPETL